MAHYVTLKGRRGKEESFRHTHVQRITAMVGGKTQLHLLSNPQPVDVEHSRKEVLKLIQEAEQAEYEDYEE
jgi:hypothetical protein